MQGDLFWRRSNSINITEDSLIAKLADATHTTVNSHHHQAVESLGADLIATAWTTDGIIEALEDPRPDRFIVAVQWHPELGWEKDSLSQRLFRVFVDEAANVQQPDLASVSTPA